MHRTKFCSRCNIPNVGCQPCWLFCHICTFSYRFNVRYMQELLLILAADVHGRCLQTACVNIICNRIINTNCIGIYGLRSTSMAHVAWSQNRWVLVYGHFGLGAGVKVSDRVKVRVSTCTCRLMDRQPSAQTSISPAMYLSYEFLNMFTDVARTTLAGRLFQMLTTRWLKKNFLIFSLDLVLQLH